MTIVMLMNTVLRCVYVRVNTALEGLKSGRLLLAIVTFPLLLHSVNCIMDSIVSYASRRLTTFLLCACLQELICAFKPWAYRYIFLHLGFPGHDHITGI